MILTRSKLSEKSKKVFQMTFGDFPMKNLWHILIIQNRKKFVHKYDKRQLIIFLSFFVVSCSNKIDMIEEGEEIPIVYSILDSSQPVQYVRVNKSFNGNKNCYEMAENPDNLLYKDSLDVKVKVLNKNSDIIKVLNFNRQNLKKDSLNNEGKVVFSTDKHYIYASPDVLPTSEDYVYKLEINKLNGEILVYAYTNSIHGFEFFPINKAMLPVRPDRYLTTYWNKGFNTEFVLVDVTVFYYEYNSAENRYYVKNINTRSSYIKSRVRNCSFHGLELINPIIDQIEKTESADIEKRFIGRLEIVYYLANRDYADQLTLDNSGAMNTSDFEPPVIFNILGNSLL